MKFQRSLVLIALAFIISAGFLSSCYYDSREELFGVVSCDTINASYVADILPILQSECYSCHDDANADDNGGGNILEGHANMLEYVEPNDPENSIIYQAVAWIPGTSFMPYPLGSQQLSACEIALFKSWIENGAANN